MQQTLFMRIRLALLVLFVLAPALVVVPRAAAQQGPSAQVDAWVLSSVADWDAGAIDGLLVINNAGGELRLAEDRTSGSFVSAAFKTPFPANALGATWEAEIAEGSELRLEIRARATPPAGEEGWGPWQPLNAGEARSAKDEVRFASPDVLAVPQIAAICSCARFLALLHHAPRHACRCKCGVSAHRAEQPGLRLWPTAPADFVRADDAHRAPFACDARCLERQTCHAAAGARQPTRCDRASAERCARAERHARCATRSAALPDRRARLGRPELSLPDRRRGHYLRGPQRRAECAR
ncbi:hypothetical protein HC891_16440, partial [Candidatus Gracilibacteria bacterium]|nr:hypothetical protein [Candidatus Gracilibacteria bacterium]